MCVVRAVRTMRTAHAVHAVRAVCVVWCSGGAVAVAAVAAVVALAFAFAFAFACSLVGDPLPGPSQNLLGRQGLHQEPGQKACCPQLLGVTSVRDESFLDS